VEEGIMQRTRTSSEYAASTATPSTSPGTVTVDCEEDSDGEDEDVAMPKELPSMGSKLHASGNCRPCNFFGKGRCSNALDCEFCHMPHQKRKPTRQEKRDRKTAWLVRQAEKGLDEKTASILEVVTEGALKKEASAEAPVQQAAMACLINFDDYSDFSDEEDEAVLPAKPQQLQSSGGGVCWSREEMLRVKAQMSKSC